MTAAVAQRPFKGGRVFTDDDAPIEGAQAGPRYPCFAQNCPMPGTIFPNGNDRTGVCAYHYNVVPSDVPRITQVLRDWECVSAEVRHARRVLGGPDGLDPKAVDAHFMAAWARLKPLAPDWEKDLAPGCIGDTKFREGYADWAKRLTEFLGGRVRDVLRGKVGGARA